MDSERFDALIERVGATQLTRGNAVRGLAGGVLAAVLGTALATSETDAKKRKRKKKQQQRRSDTTPPSGCRVDGDCSGLSETCIVGTCDVDANEAGVCRARPKTGEACGNGLVCDDEGACAACTACRDGCPGDPENNPAKTVDFTPSTEPFLCNVIVNLAGFAGCTSYTAEYWSAANPSGFRPKYYGNVTLGPTDTSGSSQTNLGAFFEGGYLDIRFPGGSQDFNWLVDC